MELQRTNLPPEVIRANFQLELNKLKYQEALQSLANYEVTTENVLEAQEKVKAARKFLTKFDEIKKEGKEAALAECRAWDSVYNDLRKPFDALLLEKSTRISQIAQKLEQERMDKEREAFRVKGIQESINQFFLDQSQAIATANTPEEITAIEKLIGSHKGNKAKYMEFLPELVEKAELLTPLIKEKKAAIKKLEAIREAEIKAEQSGDDEAKLAAMEAKEAIEQSIHEKSNRLQEKAINMAVDNPVEVEVIAQEAPKPKRTTWKYKLTDINKTRKAMPDWVVLTINEEKVDEYLKAKKAEGIEGDSFEFAGITFYAEKTY